MQVSSEGPCCWFGEVVNCTTIWRLEAPLVAAVLGDLICICISVRNFGAVAKAHTVRNKSRCVTVLIVAVKVLH
jgi:hypothetical protein